MGRGGKKGEFHRIVRESTEFQPIFPKPRVRWLRSSITKDRFVINMRESIPRKSGESRPFDFYREIIQSSRTKL